MFLKKKKIGFAISATSRLPRKNERNGIDYYFLSLNEFKKIRNNEFIEYEEVYNGIYYGTLKSEIERLNNLNLSILIDIDVKGGLNIKKNYLIKPLQYLSNLHQLVSLKKD